MNQLTSRKKSIIKVIIIGIAANIILALFKAITGWLSNSQALLSDAVNNVADSLSLILILTGVFLSAKSPDKAHPFGYGRIEYLTNFVVAVLVLFAGLETLTSSVGQIIHPEEVSYTPLTFTVIGISILVKIAVGMFTRKEGQKYSFKALEASGHDAMLDSLVTAFVGLSAILQTWFDFPLDGIAGLLIGVLIIKSGFEIIKDSLDQLLGEKLDSQTAGKIIEIIEKEPEILSANDLIINDYGPAMRIGSVNIEVCANNTFGKMYPIVHRLQMEIYEKFHIYLVFGFYSINKTTDSIQKLRQLIEGFVHSNPHILSYHGLFVNEETKTIYCDIVLDFDTDRNQVKEELETLLKQNFPDYKPMVTIDTTFY